MVQRPSRTSFRRPRGHLAVTRRHDLIVDAQWTAPAPLLPTGVAADRIGAVALAVPAGSAVPGQEFNLGNQTKANAAPAGPARASSR